MATTTGTFNWYDKAIKHILLGDIHFTIDDIGVALTTSSYTPNAATHEYLSSITNELSGSGYSRQMLTGVTLTEPSAGTWMIDSNNPTFTASGGSLVDYYYVIYSNKNATDATRELIAYGLADVTPANVTATDGNSITFQVNTSGWFRGVKA